MPNRLPLSSVTAHRRHSYQREIANHRSDTDRKLKRKEIRIVMLENGEANLKTELELRVNQLSLRPVECASFMMSLQVLERDQFRSRLDEALAISP